jgi:hypothetical protein
MAISEDETSYGGGSTLPDTDLTRDDGDRVSRLTQDPFYEIMVPHLTTSSV